jgi:hypothetical protein
MLSHELSAPSGSSKAKKDRFIVLENLTDDDGLRFEALPLAEMSRTTAWICGLLFNSFGMVALSRMIASHQHKMARRDHERRYSSKICAPIFSEIADQNSISRLID